MDLFPNLRVGIWNAWTLMLFIPLQPLIMKAIENLAGAGSILQRMGEQSANPRERTLNLVYLAIEGLFYVYAIFLPLRIGTAWFYGGVGLYVIGLVLFWGSVTRSQRPRRSTFHFRCVPDLKASGLSFPDNHFSGGRVGRGFLDFPDFYRDSLGDHRLFCG